MVILGSGLGEFASELDDKIEIPYKEIPHFPCSTAPGHVGSLVFGKFQEKELVCFKGRVHTYEGFPTYRVAFGVRVLGKMGIKKLIVTNAAGGVNPNFSAGDLMLLTNHLSFFVDDPSTGLQHPELGEYFFDMTAPYDLDWCARVAERVGKTGLKTQSGVYAMTRGPRYETAAEIKALQSLGADAVGMSTVPEVIAARQMKISCLGVSLISNMAAGISKTLLTSEEVLEAGQAARPKFKELLRAAIEVG